MINLNRPSGQKEKLESERGAIILLLSIFSGVLVVFGAFGVELGLAYLQQRAAHYGTDSAAFAGVAYLAGSTPNPSTAVSEAASVAGLNGVTSAELSAGGGIQAGNLTFLPNASDVTGPHIPVFTADATPYNAVRVKARRTVGVFLAKLIGWNALSVPVESIALVGGAGSATCVIPFGVTNNTVSGLQFGSQFTVSSTAPGNWGKIDIGGINMSAGNNFQEAMTNATTCPYELNVGDNISPGTGAGNLGTGTGSNRQSPFQQRMNSNPIVVMPIVTPFGNGNSSYVTIVGFIVARITATSLNGQHWYATFEVLNQGLGGLNGPTNSPFAPGRVLVQ